MRDAVPRPKLPAFTEPIDDAQAVEPSTTDDLTERELAPLIRQTPANRNLPDPVRSRRATLVSPIPALLAASMTEIREEKSDATPLPIDLRGAETSRFDLADQQALLDDESDYVVEVVHAIPPVKIRR